jgi:hypothetical protein
MFGTNNRIVELKFYINHTRSTTVHLHHQSRSVKITNTCNTAELIIENHTQNVPGFLFNKGRGRTNKANEFQPNTLKLPFFISSN